MRIPNYLYLAPSGVWHFRQRLPTYPGKEQNPTLQFLGVKYALTSPFGFNGAFWYARVTANF